MIKIKRIQLFFYCTIYEYNIISIIHQRKYKLNNKIIQAIIN